MRHHKKGRAFGRVDKGRTALLRSLARSLIVKEKITTSIAKAKELRPFIEKLVTCAKSDTIASRRLILSRLGSGKSSVDKMFKTIAPRFSKRPGGYTRITKLPSRLTDSSEMAVIE
ncbi:MAG: 50S ribosomal protein L17, partial [bacterium]|nr:50S ribosomal protein L17 [bacterium]